ETSPAAGFIKGLFQGRGKPVPVTVTNAIVQERTVNLTIPAKLVPSDKIDVRVPFDGRVERIFVNVGDAVTVGQPLLKLSDDAVAMRVAQRRIELKDAQTNQEKNTYFLNNRDRLLEEGRLEESDANRLESEIRANETAIEKLRQEVQELEAQREKTTIASPVDGVIAERNATMGLPITTATVAFIIARIDPLGLEFTLPPQELAGVRMNQNLRCRIKNLPGQMFSANMVSIGSAPNVDGTYPLRASINNSLFTLKPGMEAEVELNSAQKQRFFVIPAEAVTSERRQYSVFIINRGVAHRVRIVPREKRGNIIEVMDGLRDDDLIVVKGHENLEEGTAVDIWGR
ncbi:MAG: efflux RND transporter periplasmic adaptor subunit, partial [Deltaproteobacteria bacterium]|nr:efflux RND transporter periplasmic adaptor subunit [Deltaproteobacteria bacterium]